MLGIQTPETDEENTYAQYKNTKLSIITATIFLLHLIILPIGGSIAPRMFKARLSNEKYFFSYYIILHTMCMFVLHFHNLPNSYCLSLADE